MNRADNKTLLYENARKLMKLTKMFIDGTMKWMQVLIRKLVRCNFFDCRKQHEAIFNFFHADLLVRAATDFQAKNLCHSLRELRDIRYSPVPIGSYLKKRHQPSPSVFVFSEIYGDSRVAETLTVTSSL